MDRERILVIDDEKGFLELLDGVLSKGGYEVVIAEDGIEGIEKLKGGNWDLVICDIKMPGKDGYQVLKEIRQEIDKDLPVIILSTLGDFKNVQDAYEIEADFYVSKPVEFITFLKNVRTVINLRKNKR